MYIPTIHRLISLGVTLACLLGFPPIKAHADLVAHWSLDDPADSTTAVEAISGFDGAASNVTFGAEGALAITGTAAEFAGSSLVQIPFQEALNTPNFTFTAWAKAASAGVHQAVVTSRFDENAGANRHGFIIYNAPPSGTWESWAGNGEASWGVVVGSPVEIDTWTHLAVTYDDSIPERIFYINGEEVARNSERISPNSTTPFNIGAGQDFGDNFFFDGAIDDVGVWNEALPSSIVAAVMNFGVTLEGFVHDPMLTTDSTLDFGVIAPDATAQMLSLTVTNGGSAETLTLGAATISGPSASHFAVVSKPDSIAPGASADVEVQFTSLGVEGSFEATLTLNSNDSAISTTRVSLQAEVSVTDPLVAHWKLDEPAGATGEGAVADAKGGYNANATDVVFGLPGARSHTGTAAEFNGTSSTIQIPFTADLNPGSFTIAAWAYPEATGNYNAVITSRHDEVPSTILHGFIIYNASNGNWESWAGTGEGSWSPIGAEPVVVDEWVHLAVTYDDTIPERIFYVDGAEVARSSDPISRNLSSPFNIGSGQDLGDGFFFTGLIDDVALFRTALTPEEVQNVIDFGADPPTDPKLQTPGLMNLSLNGEAQNFSLTFTNTGATQTLELSNVSFAGDFIDNFSVLDFPSTVAPGEQGVIEIGFNPMGQAGAVNTILQIESNDPTNPSKTIALRGFIHDPQLSFASSIDLGAMAPNPGIQSESIEVANLGAFKTLEISEVRFEGSEAALFALTSAPDSLAPQQTGTIGFTFDPGSIDGDIRAVMILVTNDPQTPELTVPVIAYINVTTPLVAYFPLDELAGASEVTELVAGKNGTPTDVVFGEAGANPSTGTSALFNGASSLVQMDHDSSFNPRSFSITAWAKSSASGSYQSVITSRHDENTGANRHGYILYLTPDGVWESWVGTGAADWGAISGPTVEADAWTHLAVTYSASNQERVFYVNGEEVARSSLPASPNSLQPLNIGAGQDLGDGFFFNGWIDDIGIFRVALTGSDVQTIMNNGVQSITGDPKVSASRLVDFGLHASQPGPLEREIPITNSGATQTLVIDSITLAGPAANRYTIEGDITSLAPGQSGTLTLKFNSSGASGVFPATIDIVSNDEVEPLMQINLRAEIAMANQLLAHYKMDETTGSSLVDSSGRHLEGEYITVNGGSISFSQPGLASGSSVQFSKGESGESYARVAQGLPILSSFTLSTWIQRDAAEGEVEVLFSREGPEAPLWDLALLPNNSMQFFTDGGATPIVTIESVITLGEKHLVTLVHDGTTLASRIYIDGELAGENTDAPALEDSVARPLNIAARENAFSFSGLMDDVQIYSRAITAEEASFIFDNPGSALPIEGGEDLDSDGDGLTDVEEVALGTSPTNPDTDGDGQWDGSEGVAGTDPLSSQSVLKINSIVHSESVVEINLTGVAGKTYTAEISSQMTNGSWQAVPNASATAATDGDLTLTDASPPAPGDEATFYRVRVE